MFNLYLLFYDTTKKFQETGLISIDVQNSVSRPKTEHCETEEHFSTAN
jgi:hypothetical protein